MQSEVYTIASLMACVPATIFGSKMGVWLGNVAPQIPEWAQVMLGPLGALVGLVFAVVWLAKRLKDAEDKNDKREVQRQEDRHRLIEVITINTETIREAKETFKETHHIMQDVAKTVETCCDSMKN